MPHHLPVGHADGPRRLPLPLVDGDDAAAEDLRREASHVEGQSDPRREPSGQGHFPAREDGAEQDRQCEEEPDDLHQHRRAAEGLDVDVDGAAQPPAVREEAHPADHPDQQAAGHGGGGVRQGDQEALQPPPLVAGEDHVEVPVVFHGPAPFAVARGDRNGGRRPAAGTGIRYGIRCRRSSLAVRRVRSGSVPRPAEDTSVSNAPCKAGIRRASRTGRSSRSMGDAPPGPGKESRKIRPVVMLHGRGRDASGAMHGDSDRFDTGRAGGIQS